MKEKQGTSNSAKPPILNGARHGVPVQYTNKDAKERIFEFLKRYGTDINIHETAVDFFAENQDFSEGFQAYAIIHVYEDILKHLLNRQRPEPSEQFELPFEVQELGGLPQYVPYVADNGQTRNRVAGEAEWFHLESWRENDNRATHRRVRKNKNVNRIVGFFEPYMKGTKLKLRNVCETLKEKQEKPKHGKKPN